MLILDRPIGFKLDARHDKTGHIDRAIALSMVLTQAPQAVHKWSMRQQSIADQQNETYRDWANRAMAQHDGGYDRCYV